MCGMSLDEDTQMEDKKEVAHPSSHIYSEVNIGMTWAVNDPFFVAAIDFVIFGGLIMLVIDCWQKWR